MAYNFGARLQGMQPGSLYKSFWGGNNAASSPPAGTGGFKPTPTPGATPPITAQGPTMGYAQGSSPVVDSGNPGGYNNTPPPGTPRMPTTPGMTPGIMGGGGGLNNPGSRMVNPQSTSGTGPGALNGIQYNAMNQQRIQDLLTNTAPSAWGAGMANDPISTLISYGATPDMLAGNPQAMAAAKAMMQNNVAAAQKEYDYKMANNGPYGGTVSPEQAAGYKRMLDQVLARANPWLV